MKWRYAPMFFLLAAAGCSSTPRGQVVRLDPESATKDIVIADVPSPIHTQDRNFPIAVPSAHDDAAVFYFSLGQAYALDNEPGKAIEAYRSALVHDPDSPMILARLAAELVKIGSYTEAKSLCERAMKVDPRYLDSYLLLAGVHVAAKEYDQALALYRAALRHHPASRDAKLYYGVTLGEVGRTTEAVQQLEELARMKEQPDSNIDRGVTLYYLAKLHHQTGQGEKAAAALRRSLQARPGFSRAALYLADILEETGRPARALATLEEQFKESPEAEVAERLADHHLKRNAYREAVVYLETMVEEDPSNENLRLRLALIYWQLRWTEKAHMLLSQLHAKYPRSSEIAYYLGELEAERKQVDAAVGYFALVAADYSKFDQSVARGVQLFRESKRHKEAEDWLKQALTKRPDLTEFYPLMASLHEDRNDLPAARKILEEGFERFPEEEGILYYLGFVEDRLGRRERAYELMEKILKRNPQNPNALNFVGFTLLEEGKDLKLAAMYLDRAFKIRPNDPFVIDSYGWLMHRTGRTREAMRHLEKAHALKPTEAVIAEHLGDVYLALNMPRKAQVAYGRALEASSAEAGLQERVAQKLGNLETRLADGARPKVKAPPTQRASRMPASVE
ncbi:MAG: tetratricopeptide repeat protein [Bdellovibrionales bacterium]|nr:tetratricopeptide repeat protein [Bdellovibrionales bacterium]